MTKYMISTPLMIENPERSPIVPPNQYWNICTGWLNTHVGTYEHTMDTFITLQALFPPIKCALYRNPSPAYC